MGPEIMKLLAAHAINLEPTGGQPDITAEDVSHALGLLKHQSASLVLRVKYAGQEEMRRDLFVSLYMSIMEAGAKNWLRPRHHWVWDMCQVALDEFMAPALCPRCNGLGTFLHESLKVECTPCLGTGRYRTADPAEKLGIQPHQWKVWDERYREILGKLGVWEDIAISALKQIGKEEVET